MGEAHEGGMANWDTLAEINKGDKNYLDLT